MIPAVSDLAKKVQDIVQSPVLSAVKAGAGAAGKAASGSVQASLISSPEVQRKIAEFKNARVVNNEDIATACALVSLSYDNLLATKVNGVPLNRAAPQRDSFPAALIMGKPAIDFESEKLERTIKKIRDFRVIFSDVFPACIAVLTASAWMDFKKWVEKLTSMAIADGILIREAHEICRNGVSVCDAGLIRAGDYQGTLNQFRDAEKSAKRR